MKSGSRLGIVGGGYAARALARRLKYDFEVTLLSKTLYHLENDRRMENIFGGKLNEEDTLRNLDDLCTIQEREVLKFAHQEGGTFEVLDSDGEQYQFDQLVLALGSHADSSHREFFHTAHKHVFTTYTTMQSMRLRFNKEAICRGQLRIVTAGLRSKNLFNALSLALYLADLEKSVRYPYDRFKLSIHTEDNLIYPLDPQLSVFMAKMLQEKGIELLVGQKLKSFDQKDLTVDIEGKNGQVDTLPFDNLILEPQVTPNKLIGQAGKIDPAALTSESGAFVMGTCLKPMWPVLNNREIERQADTVTSQLLGHLSKYEYSPEVWVRTGINSAMMLTLDSTGKVKYHQEYSGLNFKLKDFSSNLASKAQAFTREVWY